MRSDDGGTTKVGGGKWVQLGVVVGLIAACQVSATETTRLLQTRGGLESPFLIQWCHATMMGPLYFVGRAWERSRGEALEKRGRGETVATLVGLFFGANYAYVRALALAPASYVQAMFGTAPAVVVVLSRLWLGEPATVAKFVGVALAFSGIAVLALAEDAESSNRPAKALAGLVLAELAVLFAACYKVLFKLRFGAPCAASVLVVVGQIGGLAACVGAPVAVVLVAAGLEDSPLTLSPALWVILLGGGILDVAYNALIALGLAMADSPLFVAVATILAVPLSAAVDILFFHVPLTLAFIAGTLLVLLSFLVINFLPAPSPSLPSSSATPHDSSPGVSGSNRLRRASCLTRLRPRPLQVDDPAAILRGGGSHPGDDDDDEEEEEIHHHPSSPAHHQQHQENPLLAAAASSSPRNSSKSPPPVI